MWWRAPPHCTANVNRRRRWRTSRKKNTSRTAGALKVRQLGELEAVALSFLMFVGAWGLLDTIIQIVSGDSLTVALLLYAALLGVPAALFGLTVLTQPSSSSQPIQPEQLLSAMA
eukprot:GHVS01041122.1.p3 GENE.GHVS01041122.1~~GHVS01041122.1.p3  ORF type:complete len:115 (-),score=26.63 GHVS01041122.1:504-848(-)